MEGTGLLTFRAHINHTVSMETCHLCSRGVWGEMGVGGWHSAVSSDCLVAGICWGGDLDLNLYPYRVTLGLGFSGDKQQKSA